MTSQHSDPDYRYIDNPFADYSASNSTNLYLDPSGLKLSETWNRNIERCFEKFLQKLNYGLANEVDVSDYSVYTGTTGIALLYFRMFEKLDRSQDTKYLHKAIGLLEPSLKRLKGHKVSFLCGDAGPLACGAVFYHCLGVPEKSRHNLKHLLDMTKEVVSNAGVPDELLFGRAGYLYSLMFVRKYLGSEAVDDGIVDNVVQSIVTSGVNLSRHTRSPSPLMFVWHDSYYLGAAHGLVGIFFILMRLDKFQENNQLKSLVKQSIDYLITLRFPSGNYPSSIRSRETDKLVHWCHGAPGYIHMFIQAYRIYGQQVYLNEAKSCADVIWERGLLKKGYGLCHGSAGNGYAFLMLYQLTQDVKYLHRALKFVEWSFSYGDHGCRVADRPYSLFEGLAGTMYYLVDILHPFEAAFPAFY